MVKGGYMVVSGQGTRVTAPHPPAEELVQYQDVQNTVSLLGITVLRNVDNVCTIYVPIELNVNL